MSNEVMKQNVFLMKDEVTTDEVASGTVDESEETEAVDRSENVFGGGAGLWRRARGVH